MDSVVAIINKVVTGERTSGLLQPAARYKIAEVDGCKSEPVNQLLDELLRFRIISRHENHTAAAVLPRPSS